MTPRLREVYGRAGYEAYAESTGGKTFDGRDMPTWSELPDRIRRAWSDAAIAIIDLGASDIKSSLKVDEQPDCLCGNARCWGRHNPGYSPA